MREMIEPCTDYSLAEVIHQQLQRPLIASMSNPYPLPLTSNRSMVFEQSLDNQLSELHQRLLQIVTNSTNNQKVYRDIHLVMCEYCNLPNILIVSADAQSCALQQRYVLDQQQQLTAGYLPGEAFVLAVQQSGWPLLLAEITPELRQQYHLGGPMAHPIMSWVGVPLQIAGRCIGVVASYSYHSYQRLTITDLHVLKQVAGYLALVLDRQQQQECGQAAIRQVQHMQIECLASILRIRDNETEQHSQRVMELALHLAQAMGLSAEATEYVRWGALLHDIGKIGVPDHVLFHEGPLTDEHWALMRQHPRYAEAILSSIEYLHEALDIPRYHHEKWDGTGYPYGLCGEQIPLIARMFSIIDVWDALTSDRPYRAAWSQQQACCYIAEQAGKSFDPHIVAIFLAMIEEQQMMRL